MAQEPFDIKDVFSKAMSRFSSPGGGSGGFTMPEISYNPEELRELINQKKMEALSIVIVLLAAYGAYMTYDNRTKEIANIEAQTKVLEEKEQPAEEYKKSVEDNKACLSSVPPNVEENKFISEMTALAGRRGIKIRSFDPPKIKVQGFYQLTSIRLSCTADSFYTALLFLSDIERSKYALKIDSFNVTADRSVVLQNVGFGLNPEKKAATGSRSPTMSMDLLIVSTNLLEKEPEKDNKNAKK